MKASIPEIVDLLYADNMVSISMQTPSGRLFLGKLISVRERGATPDYFKVTSIHPEVNHLLNKEYRISENVVREILNDFLTSFLSFSVDV